MTLRAHLDTLTAAERRLLAQRLGVQVIYLSQLASGFRQPSPELAIRIEAATGGAVRVEDLRPDVPWRVIRSSAA